MMQRTVYNGEPHGFNPLPLQHSHAYTVQPSAVPVLEDVFTCTPMTAYQRAGQGAASPCPLLA